METSPSRILSHSERHNAGTRAAVLVRIACLAALALFFVLGASPARAADFAGGVAIPRGFYDWAATGHVELSPYGGDLPPFLGVDARVSAYVSYRDRIGLSVASASLLLKLSPPAPIGGGLGLKPYVAAGPSANYLYSWANLEDFGTISESDFSTTASVFVGAEFFSVSKVALFLEARQTLPSDFTFDYVFVGLKLVGPKLPSIE